jgi:hypothetical protein
MPPVAPVLSVSETAFWMVAETVSVGATLATPTADVAANDVEAIVNKLAKMARVVRFMFFFSSCSFPIATSTPLPRGSGKIEFLMTAN